MLEGKLLFLVRESLNVYEQETGQKRSTCSVCPCNSPPHPHPHLQINISLAKSLWASSQLCAFFHSKLCSTGAANKGLQGPCVISPLCKSSCLCHSSHKGACPLISGVTLKAESAKICGREVAGNLARASPIETSAGSECSSFQLAWVGVPNLLPRVLCSYFGPAMFHLLLSQGTLTWCYSWLSTPSGFFVLDN